MVRIWDKMWLKVIFQTLDVIIHLLRLKVNSAQECITRISVYEALLSSELQGINSYLSFGCI